MKKLMLLGLTLVVATAAFAAGKPDPCVLCQPTNLGIVVVEDDLQADWVPGADCPVEVAKWCLGIRGIGSVTYTYYDEIEMEDVTVTVTGVVKMDFGTSDYNPDAMADPTITVPIQDILDAVVAQLAPGVTPDEVTLTEAQAAVKPLAKKSIKCRQSNIWSDPVDVPDLPPAP